MNNSKKKSSTTLPQDGKYNKAIGIRRVQIKDEDDTIKDDDHSKNTSTNEKDGYYYPHGRENPLIQHLSLYHCDVLERILFTRSPLDCYEYIAEEWRVNAFQKLNNINDDNPKKDLIIKEPTDDEMLYFLCDVMEEKNKMNFRKNDNMHFYDDELDNNNYSTDGNKENSAFTTKDNCNKNICKFNDEELVWLTKEMERDWKEFLDDQDALYHENINSTKTQHQSKTYDDNEILDDDNCDNSNEDENDLSKRKSSKLDSSKKGILPVKYKYKALITLTSHGRRCDLGTFDTAVEAAKAYDKFAQGRRTLGYKILEEFDIRRRVYARRAAYLQGKHIMNQGGSIYDAATQATMAAGEVLSVIKPEGFLITDRVLLPELNFCIDEDGDLSSSTLGRESMGSTRMRDSLGSDTTVPIGKRLRRTFDTLTDDMLYSDKSQTALLRILNEIELLTEDTKTVTRSNNHENVISKEEKLSIQRYLSTCRQQQRPQSDLSDSIQNRIEELSNELNTITNVIKNRSHDITRLIKLEKEYNTNIQSREKDRQKQFNSIYKGLMANHAFSSPLKQSFQV